MHSPVLAHKKHTVKICNIKYKISFLKVNRILAT